MICNSTEHAVSPHVHVPHIACSSRDVIPKKTKMLLPPNPRATRIVESSRLSNRPKRRAHLTKPVSRTKHLVSDRAVNLAEAFFRPSLCFPRKAHGIFLLQKRQIWFKALPRSRAEETNPFQMNRRKEGMARGLFLSCTEYRLPLLPAHQPKIHSTGDKTTA